MAPDQEWCLACGAAASTEVAEPRGWRVPIMLTGGLVSLGVIGIILAIVALSGGSEKLAQATPTPSTAAAPPATTPTPAPGATVTPLPSPTATPTAATTATPSATATGTATPEPSATPDNTSTGSGSSGSTSSKFSDWPGGYGWTVIIESAKTLAKAESVATSAQGKGHTVGILHSDDYSSLNPGYYVVFTQKYSSESAASSGRGDIKSDYPEAYVRHVTPG